jgi:hypothetical protein
MNTTNRQIIGFHVGGRGQADAKILFDKIPPIFREKATFLPIFGKVTTCYTLKNISQQEKKKDIQTI